MKLTILATLALIAAASAFVPVTNSVRSQSVIQAKKGYVPFGFTPAEWELQKEKDRNKPKNKHFKSRSLDDFEKDLAEGKVRHLFPVMFAKEEVKQHHIKPSEVPVS